MGSFFFCLLICYLTIPGHNTVRRYTKYKTWWAKYINDDLYTAGRLSEEQLKYSCDDGFRSVISVYTFPDMGMFGREVLPNSSRSRYVATTLCGQSFRTLCRGQTAYQCLTEEVFNDFEHFYKTLPKPVLMYCSTAFSATFIALLHLAKENKQSGIHNFIRKSVGMGYDYTSSQGLVDLIERVTERRVEHVIKPNLNIPDWYTKYWLLKPITKGWYMAGQVRRDHLEQLYQLDISTLINTRAGVTMDGYPSQEDVALLNIREHVFTYEGEGRQCEAEALRYEVDPTKPPEYISENSMVNYQCTNEEEFGDSVGYNETLERLAMSDMPFTYLHTPVARSLHLNEAMWETYGDDWMKADISGNVFVHCRSGRRALITALVTVGWLEGRSLNWALDIASIHGYKFNLERNPELARLFAHIFYIKV